MAKTSLSMNLPKIGDHLLRVMTGNRYDIDVVYSPEPCVVTYVNEKNGWYEVLFENSNIRECYNIPSFDHSILKSRAHGAIPILCLETGDVYSSISECGKDMGISYGNISKQLDGTYDHVNGYHFSTVF